MRVWVYGDSLKRVQNIIENAVSSSDTVVGTSARVEAGSEFPQGGLTPAISAAIHGEIDLLLIPTFELLGGGTKAGQMTELFRNYGVLIRSVSSSGISSS